MGTLIAIPAAIYVWKGIQDIGEGVRHAAKSASADAALRILYEHQAESPGGVVHEPELQGRIDHAIAAGLTR
jgi:hypothetical protein